MTLRWVVEYCVGVVIAWPFATGPIALVTWFGDNMSKDGPVGPQAYLLPGVIGLVAAGASSAFVCVAARSNPRDLSHWGDRAMLHLGCGLLAGAVLLVTFCAWWGDWSFGFGRSL
jgi:hypothetical protein